MTRNGRMNQKDLYFFSHGKTNSCGVDIGYIGNTKVDVLDRKVD